MERVRIADPASRNVPQQEETSWGDIAKEIAIDAALWVGSGAIASALGATGVGLPLAAAAIYTGSKMAQEAVTGEHQQSLVEMGVEAATGSNMSPAAEWAAQGIESALFFGAGAKTIGKLVGGASKQALKGVDLVVQRPTVQKAVGAARQVGEMAKPGLTWLDRNIMIGSERSVREMFIPGAERLQRSPELRSRNTAKVLRKAEQQKRLVEQLGGQLEKDLAEAHLSDKKLVNEWFKALHDTDKQKTLYGNMSSKAKVAVDNYEHGLMQTKTKSEYYQAYAESVPKAMKKVIVDDLGDPYVPHGIDDFIKSFEAGLSENASQKQIHKGIKNLLNDPNVSNETKQYMKDLWSFGARGPRALTKAAHEASRDYMFSKLKTMYSKTGSAGKANFERMTKGPLTGYWIPRDLRLQLDDYDTIERLAEGTGSKLLSMWKTGKTIMRPAYHFRNLFSNAVLADWGGLSVYRMDIYRKAFKEMREGSPRWLRMKNDAALATFHQNDLMITGKGIEFESNIFDHIHNMFVKATTKSPFSYTSKATGEKVPLSLAGLQNAEESFFKFAKYIHAIEEKGLSHAEAILEAQKYLFNYGEASLGAAKLRKFWVPFATWYTKVIPLAVDTAVHHPIRFGKWAAFGMAMQNYAIDQVGLTDEEYERLQGNLPEWMSSGMNLLMPWRNENGDLNMMDATFLMPGYGDFNELWKLLNFTSGSGLQIPNPAVSVLASLASKQKSSGAPLYRDWEPAGTKLAKIFSYGWDQFMPAIFGGTDYDMWARAIREEEGAPTVAQAALSSIGLKMRPVNPQEMARKKAVINQIHEREFMSDFRKAMRKAKTQKDKQKVLKRFNEIRQSESFE